MRLYRVYILYTQHGSKVHRISLNPINGIESFIGKEVNILKVNFMSSLDYEEESEIEEYERKLRAFSQRNRV